MNQPAIIKLIATNTVPVALNLYEIRSQKDSSGDFFRGVQKQRPAQYQGLYLVTAEGKVLASHQKYANEKTWAHDVATDLEPGLRAFGEIKPRDVSRVDPLPFRGVGLHNDGSITLAIYLRNSIRGIPLRELPNPIVDSLTLSAAELGEFAPPRLELGATWKFSEELSRKFSRLLGPGDEDSMPRPSEVTAFHLTAKLDRGENGVAIITYQGTLTGSHLTAAKKRTQGRIQIVGVGRYRVKTREMLSIVWLAEGVYNAPPPYDAGVGYSGVAEWVRDRK